jgi:hypothetical protein
MRIAESLLRQIIREELESAASAQSPAQIFDNTDPAYIEKTLATRNPGGSIQAGSVFLKPQTFESLRSAPWQPLSDPAIKPPAVAFTAPIAGILGIVPAEKLAPGTPVKFQLSHGGTGGKSGRAAEAVAQFDSGVGTVPNTTLIAGPKRDGEGLAVWTFHPGDPAPMGVEITMDTVLAKFPSSRATVADAVALGFNFIKRVDRVVEGRPRRG